MTSNIEINGPAYIVTAARQARDALDEGDLDLAKGIIIDMERMGSITVAWLKRLIAAGHNVPDELTWTKHIHRKKEGYHAET